MKEVLDFRPVSERPEIVSNSVFDAAKLVPRIMSAQIDSKYMGGHELVEHYGMNPDEGANCIVVRGKRGETRTTAVVLVPVGYRADLNGIVCEKLGAKKVSMAPLEEVLQETGMEYGSITPIGIPNTWKILIDSRLMDKESIIVGGGKQISKLLVPTAILRELPNAEVIAGLAASA
ncbi:MAG: ybaK / prolyl-tRNA synthetases associated domain protein [Parcubacteria group bacterium Gr01-1014_49]|nr:MAG: ybaK / prolyl-tRNA synthetases associated domain protein [Parcubacteria group bacterium Gr01-1014_49]